MIKKRDIIRIIATMLFGMALGTVLLLLVYLLPTDVMYKNMQKSIELLNSEELYEVENYSQLDNFTDSIMIGTAIYDSDESIIKKAMLVKRNCKYEDNPLRSLTDNLQNKDAESKVFEYARYWHGYLVFLKPLLLFCSYKDIRVLNTVLQIILILSVCFLMCKRKLDKYILPYILSIIFIDPVAITQSMQFSIIFYIMNTAMLLMLKYHNSLEKNNNYILFFLILGMSVSYFDFLTYPIAPLGMTTVLLLILKNNNDLKKNLQTIVNYSVVWGIGYVVMWVGKWCIGSLLSGENLFKLALSVVKFRMSNMVDEEISHSILYMLLSNLQHIIIGVYGILMCTIIIYIIYKLYKVKYKFSKASLSTALPYILISFMPIAWYVFAKGHSYIHHWFTYRSLIISIFSLLCMTVRCIMQYKKENGEKDITIHT